MPRAEYVSRKFGGRGAEVYARVSAAGRAVGIEFAFDRIVRQPNTRAAHALIAVAGTAGAQDAVADALFRAYFIEGRDLTDDAVLVEVARGAGLREDEAKSALGDEALFEQIADAERRSQRLGVTGVPFFVFDGRTAVSGAHDPEVLVGALREARAKASAGA
jgi:predicted DsbA family dithiol-disulfide isomerase